MNGAGELWGAAEKRYKLKNVVSGQAVVRSSEVFSWSFGSWSERDVAKGERRLARKGGHAGGSLQSHRESENRGTTEVHATSSVELKAV